MSRVHEIERNLLKISSFACFCFALLGIGFGIWIGSLVIVFDGMYSLISLFLSVLALFASFYIHNPSSLKNNSVSKIKATFIESIVVLIKGIVVTLVCGFSFFSALEAMLNGGREVNSGFVLIFGIINVFGCLLTYQLLHKASKKTSSQLLKAECSQWLMDTVISCAVLLGFIASSILLLTQFAHFAVFADPLMVILASLYFVSVPIKMIFASSRQLITLYQYRKNPSHSTDEKVLV